MCGWSPGCAGTNDLAVHVDDALERRRCSEGTGKHQLQPEAAGQLCGLIGRPATDPDRRVRLLHGWRLKWHAIDRRPELTRPVDRLSLPCSEDQPDRLLEHGARLADVLPEELVRRHEEVAASDDEIDASTGEGIDRRVVLGDAPRVEVGDQGHRRADPQGRRALGDGGQDHRRRRRDVPDAVVLPDVEAVEADLVGDCRSLHEHPVALGRGQQLSGDRIGDLVAQRHQSNAHLRSPGSIAATPIQPSRSTSTIH